MFETPVQHTRYYEDVFRLPDEKLILAVRVIGTTLNEKVRPQLPVKIEQMFASSIGGGINQETGPSNYICCDQAEFNK
jgi:hypothetical protein